jgi:hypothetical protein
MSAELPAYYHLSPKEIDGLSFHVTLQHNGEVLMKNELYKDIKSSNSKEDKQTIECYEKNHAW